MIFSYSAAAAGIVRNSPRAEDRLWRKAAACILAVIDGAKRTLQSLRLSFSVGWNLLAARYSH
jgi:hypothetical protein